MALPFFVHVFLFCFGPLNGWLSTATASAIAYIAYMQEQYVLPSVVYPLELRQMLLPSADYWQEVCLLLLPSAVHPKGTAPNVASLATLFC